MIRAPFKVFWAAALAALFFVCHAALLPSTLEDIDSLNFALGLHEFNPAKHQPHPPGYPIFMALGKVARVVVHSDAKALALLGAIFGALAIFPMLRLFGSLEDVGADERDARGGRIAALAVVLAVASPLYWFNALRPLSDVPGLAVTLAAQASLAAAYARQRLDPSKTRESIEASGRLIVLGALLSAIAIGFRSQAAVLTLPLLVLVLLQRAGRGAAGALLGSAMAFTIGIAAWAIPLVIATGGIGAYRAALAAQGGEDFSGVDMLYRHPTPRRLAIGLLQTFIYPWASVPLGWIVFGLAAVGMLALLWRARRAAIVILVLALPYAVFHLLFQETVTTRYALPLMPFVAYLAVCGLQTIAGSKRTRPTSVGVAILVVWSLVLTVPATRVYAREGSPTFAALTDLHRLISSTPGAAIGMHQGMLRSVQTQDFNGARILQAPPMREWLEAAAYWREGHTEPLWFLQDPARTDTELIDPLSRHLYKHYTWSFQRDDFLSGVRPDIVDLIRIDSPPGWFAEDGWHLTSETLNRSEKLGLHEATAYVRSRNENALMIIGGESLDPRPSELSLSVEGKTIDRWNLAAGGRFLRSVELPAGLLSGEPALKKLLVSYAASDGSPERLRLTQLAIEPPERLFCVQHAGWNEIEYNREMQRRWRWTTGRADTFINSGGRDAVVRIEGESPLQYFDRAPHVTVRAGAQVLATAEPSSSFTLEVKVPAASLAASGDTLTIETDETFVPHARSRSSPDMRTLGLRILDFSCEAQH